MKNVLFEQKKRKLRNNGILRKIKQRLCSMSSECRKYPSASIYKMNF
jgi:hypothetical protein